MASKKLSPAALSALALIHASGGRVSELTLTRAHGVKIQVLNSLSLVRPMQAAMYAADATVPAGEDVYPARRAARDAVKAKAYVVCEDGRTYQITAVGIAALSASAVAS